MSPFRVDSSSLGRCLAALLVAVAMTPRSAWADPPTDHGSGGAAAHSPGGSVPVEALAGQVITVGTCGLSGARHDGDTTLSLLDPNGAQVSFNDDACGGLGSRIVHQAALSGTYRITPACYGSSGCGGRIVWRVGEVEAPAAPVQWSTGLNARALVGPDGQGLVADAFLSMRLEEAGGLVLRLSGSPMGIAGGREGGVLGGSVQLTAGWDLDFVEIGIGGGVSTLSRRSQGMSQREVGVLAFRARFGSERDFHVTGQGMLGFPNDGEVDATVDASVVLPIDSVELLARGVYGMSGVWLGEVGLVWWPEGSGRGGVGIAVLAGGPAVTYQPGLPLGLVRLANPYRGAAVGPGLPVRP